VNVCSTSVRKRAAPAAEAATASCDAIGAESLHSARRRRSKRTTVRVISRRLDPTPRLACLAKASNRAPLKRFLGRAIGETGCVEHRPKRPADIAGEKPRVFESSSPFSAANAPEIIAPPRVLQAEITGRRHRTASTARYEVDLSRSDFGPIDPNTQPSSPIRRKRKAADRHPRRLRTTAPQHIVFPCRQLLVKLICRPMLPK